MLPERVYSFQYDHDGVVEKRYALPLEMETGKWSSKINVLCYDFAKRGLRRFNWDKITEVEDITSDCLVMDVTDVKTGYENFCEQKGYSHYETDNKFYVVGV